MPAERKPLVLVLGGGPDAEHDVSVESAKAVADALRGAGFPVEHRVIPGAISLLELRAMPGEVVWAVLHGPWGEGGPMQDLCETDGRPYVGCGARAARTAMDKLATKLLSAQIGVRTAPACAMNGRDAEPPLALPVVVKPVHEGSTIGLYVCRTAAQWREAHARSVASGRVCMVEPFVKGRELTVGVVAGEALPIIEIIPAEGLYDYEAKYKRDDTQYIVGPTLPAGVGERVRRDTVRLAEAIGCGALCRADFILDAAGEAWMLEVNTMPGFTSHSLVPKAARKTGIEMPALCERLVRHAQRAHADGARRPRAVS
jgi:D-alanine-D-alanine ligase